MLVRANLEKVALLFQDLTVKIGEAEPVPRQAEIGSPFCPVHTISSLTQRQKLYEPRACILPVLKIFNLKDILSET